MRASSTRKAAADAKAANVGGRPRQWSAPMKPTSYYVSVPFAQWVAAEARRRDVSTGTVVMLACAGRIKVPLDVVGSKAEGSPPPP